MPFSASTLRSEIAARQNIEHAELTYSRRPSVIHAELATGGHGNFLDASYRRILATPAWARRLEKTYTSNAQVPRAQDRRRRELECASSSDALLMNVFCYPGITARPRLAALLGVEPGVKPSFGVRAGLAMRRDEVDRTEIDMRLGDLLVEAKLTESAFAPASRERAERYLALPEVFDVESLPWTPRGLAGYQLVRGVLAAQATGGRFLLLCDGRRADLQEMWFRVLRAVRTADLRSRMSLLTWQELATVFPPRVRAFVATHYGITAR